MDPVQGLETNALNLRWSFGFNTQITSTVHSLATTKRNAIFYVSSHTGVIHDLDNDKQMLLQGHCNPISAVCVSNDKKWIVTADCGEGSMIVVWDALKAVPIKIINQPYENGVVSIDMSSDAMFLVTLSAGPKQQISVWEWTVGTNDPAMSAIIGEHEYQHSVRFNTVDVRDIVSNGQKKVIFWNWNEKALTPFHPPRGIQRLKKAVGNLTQTVFMPYTTKAVTATDTGSVVLWDYPVSELVQSTGRDAIKILKLIKSGVDLLGTVLDRYVVCGCADGAVRFFDFQFRVVAWFEDIKAGRVTSVSFSEDTSSQHALQNNGEVNMSDFQVPDFVIGTTEGQIISLQSRIMEQVNEEKRRGNLLVQGFDGDVTAMDSHPTLPVFAVGTNTGTLQLWDIDDRVINAVRTFEKVGGPAALSQFSGTKQGGDNKEEPADVSNVLTTLRFSPQGDLLIAGFANGQIKFLSTKEAVDADTVSEEPPLSDVKAFKHTQGAILDICFSKDGQYVATSDSSYCVSLYRYWHQDEEVEKPVDWVFIGKFRSHYRPIASIYFETMQSPRDGELPVISLFSLGEDRVLQEYDVARSSIRGGVKLKNSTRVEQDARPTAFVSIPGRTVAPKKSDSPDDAPVHTPDLLVVANDMYKLKVWDLSSNSDEVEYYSNVENHYVDNQGVKTTDTNHAHSTKEKNTKVCRKTLLGPTYGGPINKLFVLPRRKGSKIVPSQYLVYSTEDKVVGLIRMPYDGNPNKSMALIAHPGAVSHICSSFDGKYVMTCGGSDRSVHLWNVNVSSLDAANVDGSSIEPFISLLDGGAGGQFYQDMLDYFYYAQLKTQGLDTTQSRKITMFISIEEVIPLMCALGFYPSEEDIKDIINEIKFSHSAQRGVYKDKVDLEEFIKLYINHRPVFGVNTTQFKKKFLQLQDEDQKRAAEKEKSLAGDATHKVHHNHTHTVAIETEAELELRASRMSASDLKITRDELLKKLGGLGEKMSKEELQACINVLMGKASDRTSRQVNELMPSSFTPDEFASEVLGFTAN